MKKIREVLEKLYQYPQLRKRRVPLFLSDPGMGKSSIIYSFAKEKNLRVVELIASQASPFEVSGICMPDKELKKMTYYDYDRLESLQDGDILFIDEVGNGNPVTVAAFLTLLETRRMISGKELANIIIVAAANPQGMAPWTPQIKERFIWHELKYDTDAENYWYDNYMSKKYYMPKTVFNKLSKLVREEKFENGYNFFTPRSIDKAIEDIIYEIPTPYEQTIKLILEEVISINKINSIVDTLNEEGKIVNDGLEDDKKGIKLPNGKIKEINESITYLQLLKYQYGVITK